MSETLVSTLVHHPTVKRIDRVTSNGDTALVDLGGRVTLLFTQDELKAFISDLSMLRADMINKALDTRDVENVRLTNGNLA